MKYSILILICLATTRLFGQNTEVLGADISYRWTGADNYLVTLNIYTDCLYDSIGRVEIMVSSPSPNFTGFSQNASIKKIGEVDNCMTCTHCSNSNCPYYGIMHWKATANVKTDTSYCEYYFSWQGPKRSSRINTGSAGQRIYVEAYVNNCPGGKISSPEFIGDPTFLSVNNNCDKIENTIKAGVNYDYRFKLIPAMKTKDSIFTYTENHSSTSPIRYFGYPDSSLSLSDQCKGFHPDSMNGDIFFKPTENDISPVAIRVYQRSGKSLAGYIERDIVHSVIEWVDNSPPYVSGINGTTDSVAFLKPGLLQCFFVNTFDADQDDTVYLTAMLDTIPGASFTPETNKKWPKGEFCWNPKNSDVRAKPYILFLTAKDNSSTCAAIKYSYPKDLVKKRLYIYAGNNPNGFVESNNMTLKVFPIPATDHLFIEGLKDPAQIRIIDLLGREYTPYCINRENDRLEIYTGDLSDGQYSIQVSTKEKIYYSKLSIIR